MGQFTPTTVADGQVVDPDVFNQNMNDIQSAYDTIDDSNLVNGTISAVKLAENMQGFVVQLFIDTVGAAQADVRFDQIPLPESGELVKVKAVAEGVGAGSQQVDIKDSVDGTLLNSLMNIGAADTVVSGSIKTATKDRLENDMIRLHCTTDGTGAFTKLRITLYFKKILSS
jgi:hypothetical protein